MRETARQPVNPRVSIALDEKEFIVCLQTKYVIVSEIKEIQQMYDPYSNAPTIQSLRNQQKSKKQFGIKTLVLVVLLLLLLNIISSITTWIITHNLTLSQIPQKPSLVIPTLHTSYIGESFSIKNGGINYTLILASVIEIPTTGAFTAQGTLDACSARIAGTVTTSENIFFNADQIGVCSGRFQYTGTILNNGNISGQYVTPNPANMQPGQIVTSDGTWQISPQ